MPGTVVGREVDDDEDGGLEWDVDVDGADGLRHDVQVDAGVALVSFDADLPDRGAGLVGDPGPVDRTGDLAPTAATAIGRRRSIRASVASPSFPTRGAVNVGCPFTRPSPAPPGAATSPPYLARRAPPRGIPGTL